MTRSKNTKSADNYIDWRARCRGWIQYNRERSATISNLAGAIVVTTTWFCLYGGYKIPLALRVSMPSSFIRDKPLQALKLTVVIGILGFAFAAIVGVLPDQQLNGLLYVAFFPVILAVVVGAEALLAGYRLARTDEPISRLTARRVYTAIRAFELVVAAAAPGIFYVLIVQFGDEVPGPGAIGLLFIGMGLGLLAYGAVLLRTLGEYYYHRRYSSVSGIDERGGPS